MPRRPDDLAAHECLRLSTVESWNAWRLDSSDGVIAAKAMGSFEANSADTIYHATLAGMGIARLPAYPVADDLERGRLVRVLPDFVDDATDLVAVYAHRRHVPPKIRVFIDHLVAHFAQDPPPWEVADEAPAG